MTTVLNVQRRGCALVATIDDPATRNAMSDALLADFETVLALCREGGVRALVVRGNERVFCAGANLKGEAITGDRRAGIVAMSLRAADFYARLDTLPLPVIAVVEGASMGGGLGMAACADIVLATPTAQFALSEVRLGVVPAQIAPYVVARIGVAPARRLALTGSHFDAGEALRIGLVDEILPDALAVADRLAVLIADIRQCGPAAIAATKRLLRGLDDQPRAAFPSYAAAIFADAVLGEGAEGVAAFMAKRAPAWAVST